MRPHVNFAFSLTNPSERGPGRVVEGLWDKKEESWDAGDVDGCVDDRITAKLFSIYEFYESNLAAFVLF